MMVANQEATSFITPYGLFCNITMPFGLKNTGAMYQRTMNICLDKKVGMKVEANIDNIVVKTKIADILIADLTQTLANLCKFNIKFNPDKCVFGIPFRKLLDFIVSQSGIATNPEKITTLEKLSAPIKLKDIQKLAGFVASLSQFISHLGEKALPMYRLLHKTMMFN
jgi:hypothetical protein